MQTFARAVRDVVCMQAGTGYPSLAGCRAAAKQLLQVTSVLMVAVGSLHILAAALQDARVIVMQHEAQDCPREGSLHARGLLCGGWLEEDGDHVQGSLHQAGLMAAGAGDDGSQVGQGMLLPAGRQATCQEMSAPF